MSENAATAMNIASTPRALPDFMARDYTGNVARPNDRNLCYPK
jgi:hypothetical protein